MALFMRILLGLLLVSLSRGRRISFSCNNARKAYKSRGYSDSEVPLQSVPGDHLEICSLPSTCCTKQMEQNLVDLTRNDFESLMEAKTRVLRNLFTTRAKKFDEFFRQLIRNAERDLDIMFKKTYGVLYIQNSNIFTNLFSDLKKYYDRGDIDLTQAIDKFFMELLRKMFTLLNSQYTFNKAYLDCVTYYMDELEPFGSVPKKLTLQLTRSFVASRTFVQGLNVGRDVINALVSSKITASCRNAITNMTQCSMCRGFRDVKPCNGLCLNVYKGCLSNLAEMDSDWDAYLNAMLELVEKMDGAYSIETAIDPIDVKISNAIMNLQENGDTVSKKIFSGCGSPAGNGVKKRSANDNDFFIDTAEGESRSKREAAQEMGFPYNKLTDNPDARPTTAAGTSLERLTSDFRSNVKNTKGYWSRLPSAICTDEKVAADVQDENDCWNGNDRSKYSHAVVGDGLIAQINNPAVVADTTQVSPAIRDQASELRNVVTRLHKAINGEDVKIEISGPDEEDTSGEVDISASGSASGDDNEIPTDEASGESDNNAVDNNDNNMNTYGSIDGDKNTNLEAAHDGKSSSSSNALSILMVVIPVVSYWFIK